MDLTETQWPEEMPDIKWHAVDLPPGAKGAETRKRSESILINFTSEFV